MRSRLVALAVACALLLTTTGATAGPAVPARDRRLRARLEAVLAQPELRVQGRLGVRVTDAAGGVVLDRRGHTPLLPASTLKLVTAAAALRTLGPGFRYVTRVAATRQPDDGVVRGDLVIVGSGDPALATATFARVEPDRPRTPLEALAGRLRRAGVRRVTGRVVGDAGLFAHEPLAAGWPGRYLYSLDTTRVSGLTVNGGRELFLRGGRLQARPAKDPAREAAALLTEALADRGVKVAGAPAAGRVAGQGRPAATVARVRSDPLLVLLRHTLQQSDNHMADAIFRTLGSAIVGRGGWSDAGAATRLVLSPLGLDWGGVVIADGSGLSRADRVTAAFLTQLDAGMSGSRLTDSWQRLQAVAGRSGTLEDRLVGTIAEGRLHGKTGTLTDVRALAGSVEGPGGERVHLAVVANGLDDRAFTRAGALADELAIRIVAELYDCRRAGRPSPVWRCAG